MTHTKHGFAFALLLLWGACGMRTGFGPGLSPDEEDDGGFGGGGGQAAGGAGGHGSGGRTSAGGSTTVSRGGSGGNVGGSIVVGRGGSGGNIGGSMVVAGGGSGGKASGGSGGKASGGSGGKASGGSGGSGGKASGGSSAGGAVGTGGAMMKPDGGRDVLPSPDAMPGAPTIDPSSGYATVPAGTVIMSGYVTTSAGGSGSSIGLTCTESSFCASGTVGASPTYNSWANASFNVNQAKSGSSGSTGSLQLVGSTVSISYVNPGGSQLELQFWDGNNFWCNYLPAATTPTTTTVPLSSLNTKCWDGTGSAFVSGTSITAVQLAVPGSATKPTPFDYCFLGLTVQ